MKRIATILTFVGLSAALRALPPYAPEVFQTDDAAGEKIEMMKFGDFNSWVVRPMKESRLLGGNDVTLYAIGPNKTLPLNTPYTPQGGSPWATSNVMASPAGIVKTNISVYREARAGHGYCAKLYTHFVECKALGMVNIRVLAAGSIFLGEMQEPIKGASNPMAKLDCGIKFTRRPKAIMFDYKVKLAGTSSRVKKGTGRETTVSGMDQCDCMLLLQKRWETPDGKIHALRVGTMVVRWNRNTADWVNNARYTIHYGDISSQPFYKSYMGMCKGDDQKYAKNSKGKIVEIIEEGWADANETPTHLCLQFDSSHGGAYVGSVGNTLWVDNVRLVY